LFATSRVCRCRALRTRIAYLLLLSSGEFGTCRPSVPEDERVDSHKPLRGMRQLLRSDIKYLLRAMALEYDLSVRFGILDGRLYVADLSGLE
jgi:hypothetical protein